MIRALYSSASSMVTQQQNMDIISNNIANTNTTGYKKSVLHSRICCILLWK